MKNFFKRFFRPMIKELMEEIQEEKRKQALLVLKAEMPHIASQLEDWSDVRRSVKEIKKKVDGYGREEQGC